MDKLMCYWEHVGNLIEHIENTKFFKNPTLLNPLAQKEKKKLNRLVHVGSFH